MTDDDKMDIVCIWLMSIGCLGSMALVGGGALTALWVLVRILAAIGAGL
jgi:hypothetical protein